MNVTLIGADGAGKSTISQSLRQDAPFSLKIIYMGINFESSNYVLPTTWLILRIRRFFNIGEQQGGPPDPARAKARSKNPIKRFLSSIRTTVRFINLIAEEWYRQFLAWVFQLQGNVVIFDRHFYLDFYEHHIDVDKKDMHFANRFHGYMLEHWFPKPDFVIFLDGPPELLFERKGEGSVELLEMRRQEYLGMQKLVDKFVIVNVDQPVEDVKKEVIQVILDHAKSRKTKIKVST
jgi:thymidylate kinase